MTPTEPRPAFLVRVDDVLAGDKAGLLHYSVRERIVVAIEGAARRWGIDPAAVSITEMAAHRQVETPRLVQQITVAPGVTPEQIAADVQKVLVRGRALDDIEATEAATPDRPGWWRRALRWLRGGRQ